MVRPPIIVNEHGDIHVFPSVEEAETYLEPVDVRNNEYVAYDSEGRRLILSVRSRPRTFLFGLLTSNVETVAIGCEEEQPQHAEELRIVLAGSLQRRGHPADVVQGLSLRALMSAASEGTRHR